MTPNTHLTDSGLKAKLRRLQKRMHDIRLRGCPNQRTLMRVASEQGDVERELARRKAGK